MCYVMDAEKLEESLDEWTACDPELERILPGLSAYQTVDEKVESRPSELVRDQIDRALKRGAGGACFFALHHIDEAMSEVIAGVKE